VAAIAGIGEDAFELVADQRLHIRDDLGQRVPVIRIARQGGDMGDELTAAWALKHSGKLAVVLLGHPPGDA
jgi:hypothetical protein